MPINGHKYEFTNKNIDSSPAKHGVYALFDGDSFLYYGRAMGKEVTIRSRLRDHKEGSEGRCTQTASHYKCVTSS
jgi:hypothetical protein